MSGDDARPTGLALRCDRAGTVVEVLMDTIDSGLVAGSAFTQVVGAPSIADALTLLSDAHGELPSRPAALELHDGGGRLHVVGCSAGVDHAVLVGAPTSTGLPSVIDALAPGLREVRARLQEISARGRINLADEHLLGAMSATNNELVDMHRELARTQAEMARLNRRKDEILAMVAHDLRNPIGAIAGFGAALERQLGPTLNDTSRLLLSRIQALSSRMLELVNDLLDTAAIEHDTLQLKIEPADLHRLLGEILATHEHAAAAKGVALRLDLHQALPQMWVDDRRLAQVVDNLVSNAIKFTPTHTGAQVTVACMPHGPDHVVISVRDQGVGLSAADRDRLFEPFSGRNTLGTADESGTGLGLAITRSLVEAHGGSIDVDSELGQGSTFTVTLPVRPLGRA